MARKKANSVSFGFNTAAMVKARYNRNYGFQKAQRAPSPAHRWENYLSPDAHMTSLIPPKERAMIYGTPHGFKGVRTGNSYGSRLAVKHCNKKMNVMR